MLDSRAEYRRHLLRHEMSEIVGVEHTSVSPGDLRNQAADWSWMAQLYDLHDLDLPVADVVVKPGSAEEVAAVLAVASDQRIPVVPRGGGSGTQGGTFALYGGIALDLTRMDKIIDIDETSMTVTTEAGVTGPQLEEVLGKRGLAVAHEPGSFHFGATVGGWLAARGSGVRSTKYGKPEDQVLQLEVALPPGELASTLPVPSHAAGPGLLQLLVGSEGTMGAITSAKLRMDPIPESIAFLTFEFESVFDGLEAGRRIMTERWRPAVMRLYDEADREKLNKILGIELSGALMIVVCDGDQRLVDLEAEAITEICTAVGASDLGEAGAKTWWDGKYEPYAMGKAPRPPTIFGTTDTVCTFDDMPDLYRAKRKNVEEGFAEYGATYTAHFSHWYPWGVMVYDRFYVHEPPADPMDSLRLHDQLWDAAVRVSLNHGGVVNEHHGVGIKLGRFMREQYGTMWPVMQSIKDAIDPDGILNPGKLGFGPPR
ncbi:MAG: FAD-binding oxidoreductase [Acidimicrobiia bacterium]